MIRLCNIVGFKDKFTGYKERYIYDKIIIDYAILELMNKVLRKVDSLFIDWGLGFTGEFSLLTQSEV